MKLRFVRSVHTKPTQPKTSSGCSPSPGYNLTACRQGNAEASKNLFRRTTPPPRLIAAVSAAEENLTQSPQSSRSFKKQGESGCVSSRNNTVANEKISECESAALAFVLDGLPSSGEAPLPIRAIARDVLKPLPLVACVLDANRF